MNENEVRPRPLRHRCLRALGSKIGLCGKIKNYGPTEAYGKLGRPFLATKQDYSRELVTMSNTGTKSEQLLSAPHERKLVAIMVADIVGFSRLMESAESQTFVRVRHLREKLTTPAVAKHGGRVIKTTGDGFLAEFGSATAAVRCGIDIQRSVTQLESGQTPETRICFRIGINVGDVLLDGDDVAGDGVNIAARLESIAPLGGLCISAPVHDQIRDDLGVQYEDLGEQKLKNIARPIRAFAVTIPTGALANVTTATIGTSSPSPAVKKSESIRGAIRKFALPLIAATTIAIGGLVAVAFVRYSSKPGEDTATPPTRGLKTQASDGTQSDVRAFSSKYAGTGTFLHPGQKQKPFAWNLSLHVNGTDVTGQYASDSGDIGTMKGKLEGNGLELDVVSNLLPGRCLLRGSLSTDASRLSGIYRCPDGEHGEFILTRQQ